MRKDCRLRCGCWGDSAQGGQWAHSSGSMVKGEPTAADAVKVNIPAAGGEWPPQTRGHGLEWSPAPKTPSSAAPANQVLQHRQLWVTGGDCWGAGAACQSVTVHEMPQSTTPAKSPHLQVLQRLGAQACLVLLPRPLAPLQATTSSGLQGVLGDCAWHRRRLVQGDTAHCKHMHATHMHDSQSAAAAPATAALAISNIATAQDTALPA